MKFKWRKLYLIKNAIKRISYIAIILTSLGSHLKISTSTPVSKHSDYKESSVKNSDHFDPEYFDSDKKTSEENDSKPDEQKLIMKLLDNYEPAARPVLNSSNTVTIKFGLSLIQLCDIDEKNQILTINVWLEQEWFDECLQWNESEYNGLNKIRLPCSRIWIPDIVLYNSADDLTDQFMQSKAMVKSNGLVFWPQPAQLKSSCVIDVTFFPFDDQICHLKFGSWAYSELQVNLINKTSSIDLSNYVINGEWDLKNVVLTRNVNYYSCCPEEGYPDVIFYIYLRRRVLYYLTNIIFPCVWLSILSLVCFLLPPDSGEKITLGITVLLAFSVFMLLIAENIPATSETVPLIGIYLLTTMALTSISLVLTVYVLQLHHAGKFAPKLSRKLYYFMTKKLAVYIGLKQTVKRYEAYSSKINNDEYNIESLIQLTDKLKSFIVALSKCNKKLTKQTRSFSKLNDSSSSRLIFNHKIVPNHLRSSYDDSINVKECSKTIGTCGKSDHSSNKQNLCQIKSQDKLTKLLKYYLKKEELNNKLQNELKLLALIVDRLLFWIFTIITVVSSLVLLVVLPVLKNST